MRDRNDSIMRRDMRLSTVDSALHSTMVGLGENYLVAFALAAGLGEVGGGLIAPVPQFAGAAIALLLPRALSVVGSIRALTIAVVTLQGLALLGFAAAAWAASAMSAGAVPAWALFLLAGMYWTGAFASGPVWNVWAGTMFPGRIRARFFGRRSRVSHVSTVTAVVLAGMALGPSGVETSDRAWVYAVLFAGAGLARVLSAVIMSRQSERVPIPPGHRDMPFAEFMGTFCRGATGRMLVAMLAFNLATAMATSFLTPYMLDRLHITYRDYMVLIATSLVTKAAVAPLVGNLAARHGVAAVVTVAACAVAPLPALWLVSDGWAWLVLVHVVSGAAWAAYELAGFILMFDAVADHRRVGMLARFNLLNNAAIAIGAGVGAATLWAIGEYSHSFRILFGISAVAACLAVPLLVAALQTSQGSGRRETN